MSNSKMSRFQKNSKTSFPFSHDFDCVLNTKLRIWHVAIGWDSNSRILITTFLHFAGCHSSSTQCWFCCWKLDDGTPTWRFCFRCCYYSDSCRVTTHSMFRMLKHIRSNYQLGRILQNDNGKQGHHTNIYPFFACELSFHNKESSIEESKFSSYCECCIQNSSGS